MKAAFASLAALGLTAALAADAPPGPVFKGTQTGAGQPIVLPQGAVEVTAAISELAAGATTPVHRHPFPRYGYVLSGRIAVTQVDSGKTAVFGPGEFFVDPVELWHSGAALDGKPARFLVIDQAPPGRSNVVLRDPPPAPAQPN